MAKKRKTLKETPPINPRKRYFANLDDTEYKTLQELSKKIPEREMSFEHALLTKGDLGKSKSIADVIFNKAGLGRFADNFGDSHGQYNINRNNIPNPELRSFAEDDDWFYDNQDLVAQSFLANNYLNAKKNGLSGDAAWEVAFSGYNKGFDNALQDNRAGRVSEFGKYAFPNSANKTDEERRLPYKEEKSSMSKTYNTPFTKFEDGGYLSSILGGAASGAALGPIGMAGGAAVGILTNLLQSGREKKLQKQREKVAQQAKDKQDYLSDMIELQQYNAKGGRTKTNAEVEHGEYLLSKDTPKIASGGKLKYKGKDTVTGERIYDVVGKSHEGGGVKIQAKPGTKVISEQLGYDDMVEQGQTPSKVFALQELMKNYQNGGKMKKYEPGGFIDTATKVLPFASDILRTTTKPPKPIAPQLQKLIKPRQVSFDDQVNESRRQGSAMRKSLNQTAGNPNAFKAGILSQMVNQTNQIKGNEKRQNAMLGSNADRINAQIGAGNTMRTNQYLSDLLQYDMDKKSGQLAGVAGAMDRMTSLRDFETNQKNIEEDREMMKKYYKKASDFWMN